MVTRQKDVSDSGFQLRMQAEEAASVPGSESVGWMAISSGTDGSSTVGTTGVAVGNADYSIALESDQTKEPFFFSAMQTFKGTDTATIRMKKNSAAAVAIFVEEEDSRDGERTHAKEDVGFAALYNNPFS